MWIDGYEVYQGKLVSKSQCEEAAPNLTSFETYYFSSIPYVNIWKLYLWTVPIRQRKKTNCKPCSMEWDSKKSLRSGSCLHEHWLLNNRLREHVCMWKLTEFFIFLLEYLQVSGGRQDLLLTFCQSFVNVKVLLFCRGIDIKHAIQLNKYITHRQWNAAC